MNMTMELVFVTPQIAAKFLESNVGNRKLKKSYITNKLAPRMAAGKYIPNHEAIAFTVSGKMFDGQHRLHSIIESQVPQWLWVCRNVPEEAILITNIALKKSLADRATLQGNSLPCCNAAAIANVMMTAPCSVYGLGRNLDDVEVINFCHRHANAISFAAEQRTAATSNSGVRGAIARAYYYVDKTRLGTFRNLLANGVNGDFDSRTDSAAIRLRDYLLQGERGSGASYRNACYMRAQQAIKLFADGTPVKLLRSTTADLFPLKDGANSDAQANA